MSEEIPLRKYMTNAELEQYKESYRNGFHREKTCANCKHLINSGFTSTPMDMAESKHSVFFSYKCTRNIEWVKRPLPSQHWCGEHDSMEA